MSKKKEKIIIGILIVLLLVLTVGVSYAAFKFTGTGTKVNTITTGAISMTYEETENVISLDKALPTTDKTGKTLDDYFEFTVSGNITGDTNINYEISAKAESNNTFSGDNVKLYLTRVTDNGEEEVMSPKIYNEEANANSFTKIYNEEANANSFTGRPAGEMSLYTSSMNASESNTYRLRMYVTEEYNPQGDGGNKTFSVKVNVYGRDRVADEVSDVLLANIPKENLYDDGVDTFITGEEPNNYVWYSGKLWRAVSVNNESKTTKLVTQWNISTINYSSGSTDFAGSYMESWLNDTSADGFLGNLRDYENFIVTDSVWDATLDDRDLGSIERPNGTSISTSAVGLLNIYEYQISYTGTNLRKGYLNNGLFWITITPNDIGVIRAIISTGFSDANIASSSNSFRPSINLKSNIRIVDGDGTVSNPYRLEGDNDSNLTGTMLNTRYSGEYIKFGTGENNLYRIVSHESEGLTKITSAKPLKENGEFKKIAFDSNENVNYSNTNTIGTFLNGEYLTSGKYLTDEQTTMIEDNTTWYLGTVGNGTSYKLAKYTDETGNTLTSSTTTAKAGLLRSGELMSNQFDRYNIKGGGYFDQSGLTTNFWTLTPYNTSNINSIINYGIGTNTPTSNTIGIRPSLNLKANVVITGGNGTKQNPFSIELKG